MKGFLEFVGYKKQNDPKNNIHFELCGCKSEVLVLEYAQEIGLMDLAIYEHGASIRNKMSWRQKLRYIWQVILHNRPYNDQIVLEKKQIQNLYDFLKKIIKDNGL